MKRRAVVIVCAGALVAVLAHSLVQWSSAARYGWTGLEVALTTRLTDAGGEDSFFLVKSAEPLSPGSRAGLRRGDEILAIDGSPGSLVSRFRQLKPDEPVRMRIGGPAPRVVTLQPVAPLSQGSVLLIIAVEFAIGVVSIAIGWFVLRRRPDDVRALVLFAFTCLYALTRFVGTEPVHTFGADPRANLVPIVVAIGCSLLLFPVLLHFCLVFPRPRPLLAVSPGLVRGIYLYPSLLAIVIAGFVTLLILGRAAIYLRFLGGQIGLNEKLLLTGVLALGIILLLIFAPRAYRNLRDRGWRLGLLLNPGAAALVILGFGLGTSAALRLAGFTGPAAVALIVTVGLLLVACILSLAVVYPIAACVTLWRNYREANGEEKRQLRWPLWGLVVAVAVYLLAGPLLFAVQAIAGFAEQSTGRLVMFHLSERLPKFVLLLIPLSIAFAVLKHRLMDIDVYVRKTMIYGGATGILGLLYLAVVGGLGGLVSRTVNISGDWFPIGTTMALAVLFVPLRVRLQNVVDRRFYRQRDYSGALRGLTARLSNTERGAIPWVAADAIQQAIPARSAAVWLASREAPVFEVRAKSGPSDEALRARVSISGSLARSFSGSLMNVPDSLAADEAEAMRLLAVDRIVPLQAEGRVHGFVTIGRKLSDAEYDREDAAFLETAAAQIAIALQHAVFASEREEVEKAREIQTALLPRSIPQPAGMSLAAAWQPARSVGGDYYDVIELGDGRLGVAIADVAGKGVPAALLMSNLQASLKLLAPEIDSPRRLCTKVNEVILRVVTPARYITFFYAVLDSRARTLVYCNAGHNPPLVVSTEGSERLESGGPPLGLFAGAAFEEGTVQLRPGDRVVLYTDGVSEALGDNDEEFGEERLSALLRSAEESAAGQMSQAIVKAVTEHCRGVFADDVTLLVLSVDRAGAMSGGGTGAS
jgi:serine phosphatase RsbU (regulator of sigma subunit)